MYFDRRLFGMTRGVRGRIALAAVVGLIAVPVAMWRLVLTGQTMARVFSGEPFNALLASLLRLDVDHGDPYAIPPSNPFASGAAGAPEVWAKGLRTAETSWKA